MTFLLGLILSTAHAFNININKYNKENKWYNAPSIIICNDSPVSAAQIKKAAKEWKEAGIKININNIKQERYGECKDYYQMGKILIMGKRKNLKEEPSWHAVTRRWYTDTKGKNKNVIGAYIEIRKRTILSRPEDTHKLLTHEIGHALGYAHTSIKNDIMIGSIMQ